MYTTIGHIAGAGWLLLARGLSPPAAANKPPARFFGGVLGGLPVWVCPLPATQGIGRGVAEKQVGSLYISIHYLNSPMESPLKLLPNTGGGVAEKRRTPFGKGRLKNSKNPVLTLAAGRGQPCEPMRVGACRVILFPSFLWRPGGIRASR